MSTMEHMLMEWEPVFDDVDGEWVIQTKSDDDPWDVLTVHHCLPGCHSGEETAKAICQEHNALLRLNMLQNTV